VPHPLIFKGAGVDLLSLAGLSRSAIFHIDPSSSPTQVDYSSVKTHGGIIAPCASKKDTNLKKACATRPNAN
jgi:hypothetical protein